MTVLAACVAPSESTAEGTSELTEGSEEAKGVLEIANTAPLEELTTDAKLHPIVAQSIVDTRNGPDRRPNSADDDPFDSLSELGRVEHFGPHSLRLLQQYWTWKKENGVSIPALPKGEFERFAYFRFLAWDDTHRSLYTSLEEIFGPREANAVPTVEPIRCRLFGKNPGTVQIECQRDRRERDFHPMATLRRDGSFEINTTPDGANWNAPNEPLMRMKGRVDLTDLSVTVESYQFVMMRATGGACILTTNCRPEINVKLGEEGTGRFGNDCDSVGNDPNFVTLKNVWSAGNSRFFGKCPVCYEALAQCDPESNGPARLAGRDYVCLNVRHDMSTIRKVRGETCGAMEHVGDVHCNSYSEPYNYDARSTLTVCKARPHAGGAGVPDEQAVVMGQLGGGCPSGYRSIYQQCKVRLETNPSTPICLDNRITDYQLNSCPLGYHPVFSQYCVPQGNIFVCLPD